MKSPLASRKPEGTITPSANGTCQQRERCHTTQIFQHLVLTPKKKTHLHDNDQCLMLFREIIAVHTENNKYEGNLKSKIPYFIPAV
jgi:hypothetical protein